MPTRVIETIKGMIRLPALHVNLCCAATAAIYCFATQAFAQSTVYTYDALNRLTSVNSGNGGITSYTYDAAGNRLTYFSVLPTSVVGRLVFYNNCAWDGNDPAANANDDAAIAPDKTALLPGGIATFANYTSFNRGINGLMVDISALAGTPTADDFIFRVGNDNNPGSWPLAPAPSSITVRTGVGAAASDRITLIWPDNAIQKKWLQVTVKATANTGLAEPDVFYFGNAIGEAGNADTDAKVNPSDELLARSNPRNVLNPAPIDFLYDYNRDQRVNPADQLIARANQTSVITALRLIDLTGALLAAVAPSPDNRAMVIASESAAAVTGVLTIRMEGTDILFIEYSGVSTDRLRLQISDGLTAGQWTDSTLQAESDPVGGTHRWQKTLSEAQKEQFFRIISEP